MVLTQLNRTQATIYVWGILMVLRFFKVHPSAGFTSRNKVSVSSRSNHREWLTRCKNFYYCYEKKARLN